MAFENINYQVGDDILDLSFINSLEKAHIVIVNLEKARLKDQKEIEKQNQEILNIKKEAKEIKEKYKETKEKDSILINHLKEEISFYLSVAKARHSMAFIYLMRLRRLLKRNYYKIIKEFKKYVGNSRNNSRWN